jgi:hypothetical protein
MQIGTKIRGDRRAHRHWIHHAFVLVTVCVFLNGLGDAQQLSNAAVPAPRVPDNPEGLRIKLVRTSCFGYCPVYSLEIGGDGTVSYEGEAFVKVRGGRKGRIATADVRKLTKYFAKAGYFSLQNSYGIPGYDEPSSMISIRWPGFEKTVWHHQDGSVKVPSQLLLLQDLIDVTANSFQWAGSETDVWRIRESN